VKQLTEKQKELAARKLCLLRGIDPDERINWGFRWTEALREIESQEQLQIALETGRLGEPFDKEETQLTTPPTIKDRALALLEPHKGPIMLGTPEYRLTEPQVEFIRKALRQLPDGTMLNDSEEE
jgi:hypothetical protein